MRHVVIHRPGGHDRLQIETAPDPKPDEGEVVVESAAIGVNYADCIVRMGLYESAKKYVGWPITPGFEVAGTVCTVGERVHDVRPGARVIAVTRFGGYASHVRVPRDQLFRMPGGLSFAQAAAIPAVFLTAHYALFDLAAARPEHRLLVHSAAGGVGGALLQLARIAGCRAVGVVGASHKVDAARRAGATAVIDKSTEDLWRMARRHAPDGYDAIFDANGVSTLGESWRHLASPGRLVVYGFHSMLPRRSGRPDWAKLAIDWLRTPRFNPIDMTNANKSVMAFNLSYLFERKAMLVPALEQVLAWFEEGKLAAPPITEYALDDVVRAHAAIESGQTVGKLVLVPRQMR
ncbi:MAG TPA: medium chain dehydrogenase/reductase family protein [Polyangiaceae bacterium]|nr:medium chain dehydrogenase/reductase family protein [Polyangiaceae bacterium]